MFARIFVGADGKSHFEDIDVLPSGVDHTAPEAVTNVHFRTGLTTHAWHSVDSPRYLITLSGVVEVECEDGEKRRFGPGDVLLHWDVIGKGHRGRIVSREPRTVAIIPLAKRSVA